MAECPGLQPADVRALLRLTHQVHTCANPMERKLKMTAGLCALLRAQAGVSLIARWDEEAHRPVTIASCRYGAAGEEEQAVLGWLRPPSWRDRPAPDWAGPGGWRAIASWTRCRLHHALWCPIPSMDDAWVAACLSLVARPRRKPFNARDRLLLHVAHLEMNWVYRGDVLLASPAAQNLTPRQRETLQYLLAGDGEKQIAAKLRLSHNTVHHYVKAIHRHFGISSRSELLALWLR